MKPTFSQVEAFFWIARLTSFHAAAAQLNLTQPTISLRIRSLESALGVRLFERSGRNTVLSREGASLLPWAERMMALSEELSAERPRLDPINGRLRLGAADSFGLICMPKLLEMIRKQFQDLDVVLTIDKSAVLDRLIAERKLDVALLVDPAGAPHLRTESLGLLEHRWVAAKHLGLKRRVLRPEELVARQIITNPAPSTLLNLVLNWFATAGLAPSHISTCNNLMVVLELVMAGEAFSLLPTSMLSAAPIAKRIQVFRPDPVIDPPQFFAVYQIDKYGACMKVVLDATRAVIAATRYAGKK